MEKYQNAASGLKLLFIAQIGAIACRVLSVIPVIGLVAGIGAIVFLVLNLMGLFRTGKDIEGCQKAFTLSIVSLILSILNLIPVAILRLLVGLASYVVSFLIVYLVCTSVGEVMKELGSEDVASTGGMVWKINLVCYAALIVISILSLIPIINIIAGLLGIVVTIVSLVALVLYMIFLYKSSQKLAA